MSMPGVDTAAIDAIVAASKATTGAKGHIVQVTTPFGDYAKAYGTTEPNTGALGVGHHFRMGSVTKMFTALKIWQLIDAGFLSLSDTLAAFVPDIPFDHDNSNPGERITVEHLLTMRSGVFDYTDDSWVSLVFAISPTANFTRDSSLKYMARKRRLAEPGTVFDYSNSNAILLAIIAEKVDPAGRSFRDMVLQDVIAPLGLTQTTWPTGTTVPAPAAGTAQQTPGLTDAAGVLITTAADLTRFAQAVRDGELLSPAAHEAWHTQWPTKVGPDGYGHFIMSLGQWIGHGGSIRGFTTACLFDSVSGATIVVSENAKTAGQDAFYVIAQNIAEVLRPGSTEQPLWPDAVSLLGSLAGGLGRRTVRKASAWKRRRTILDGPAAL